MRGLPRVLEAGALDAFFFTILKRYELLLKIKELINLKSIAQLR
jgi:hypothetical protein